MKAFLEAKKRETRLTGHIERYLLTKPFDDRRMDVLHPSDIIKPEWCHLASYHALSGNYQETREKPNLRLSSIFEEGHSIHAKWQGWISEMGYMYGKWKCNKCGSVDPSLSTEPTCATHGKDTTFTYAEVNLRSKKHMIFGHTDGWVKGLGDDFLIEIKSLGPGTFRMEAPGLIAGTDGDLDAAFRAIRQPFRSHFMQGQVYLHLAHLMVENGELESAPEEIVFIYELKSNQDYKEFTVGYDPDYTEDIFDAALDIVWAVEQGKPPACNIDPVNGCKRCAPFRGAEHE